MFKYCLHFVLAYVAYMNGSLETSHVNAWFKSWKEGRIDITGNISLARTTYASYYYILSSVLPPDPEILVKPWPFVGLSPGDLAHGALGRVIVILFTSFLLLFLETPMSYVTTGVAR